MNITTNSMDYVDTIEATYAEKVDAAAKEILRYITNVPICTYGSLSVRYPEYVRVLDAALIKLKDERHIDFNDIGPAPTRITLGNSNPVKPLLDAYFNNQKHPKGYKAGVILET
jgi:hypothetical protein